MKKLICQCTRWLPVLILLSMPLGADGNSLQGRQITLMEAVTGTLRNNLDIAFEEYNPLVASAGVRDAWGEFAPTLFAEASRQFSNRDQNAIDLAANGLKTFRQYNTLMRTGLGLKTPLGTAVELSTDFKKMDNSVNRQGPGGSLDLENPVLSNIFNPEFETFAGIVVTQPLLKGFGPTAALFRVREARVGLDLADQGLHVVITNQVVAAVDAFYDMVFGQENLKVKQEAVRLAERLTEDNRRRLQQGKATPFDVSQAEVKVSEAMEEVWLAEDYLRERRVRLLKLMLAEFNEDSLPVFTAKAELPRELPRLDARDLTRHALENRPDLLMARIEVEREKLNRRAARNQSLPELNVQMSYGLNGLSNKLRGSYNRLLEAERPSWALAVAFSVPIPDISGQAQRIASLRKVNQAETKVRAYEVNIPIEIRNSINKLDVLAQRLRTAEASRNLAEEALRAEELRLESGRSTSFNVLEMLDQVSAARTRELAALVEIRKAEHEVWALSGRILPELGLELPAPRRERFSPILQWHHR